MQTTYVPGDSYVKISGPAWVTTDGYIHICDFGERGVLISDLLDKYDLTPNVQNIPRGYYIGPDYVIGADGSYVMRYTRTPLDWRGKTAMAYAPKLIGQLTLYVSEGRIYEMMLDVTRQKVKQLNNHMY